MGAMMGYGMGSAGAGTNTAVGHLGKIRGCLVGGAVGDALGYPVEFLSYREIVNRFGKDGIWGYSIEDEHGRALFSDDTQMTLFTAVGLLDWGTKPLAGVVTPRDSIYRSYLDWLSTQSSGNAKPPHVSWLVDARALHERRAPGNTCLSALGSGRAGEMGNTLNSSKGCGGVMRVAPIGLFGYGRENTVRWAAEAAALTHGHPLGYIPAGVFANIVRTCAFSTAGTQETPRDVLAKAVDECIGALPTWFPQQLDRANEMAALLALARELAGNGMSDVANIKQLGEGWVGEEALAIAVYCCLRYPDSFDGAIIAAVNHDGDSDSTGSIAGNIMGALLGIGAIGERWTTSLELYELIIEVADALNDGRMPSQERMARAFAQRAHTGQVDKAGVPYILHPQTVASQVEGDAVKAAAWLHDVVEDTPATLDDLQRYGFSEDVVMAVAALTRREGEDYLGFVHRAARNEIARQVKIADVVHNMDLSRLPRIDAKAVARIREKYVPALEILIGTRVIVKG